MTGLIVGNEVDRSRRACCQGRSLLDPMQETFFSHVDGSLPDVCLKDSVGIADSLYNLRLIRTFCERHLVLKCFHFTYEDLLYGRENLQENVLVFLAELFFLLEAMEQGDAPRDTPAEGLCFLCCCCSLHQLKTGGHPAHAVVP